MCYFEIIMLHITTRIPEGWRNCLCLEKTCDGFVGFVASHRMCASSTNSMKFAKTSSEYMDILSCAREKNFEPNATSAYIFRFDCNF